MENQFVIVRADRAGVFFGKLKEKNGNEVTLTECRKIFYWRGAAAVEEIAMVGTKNPEACKITVTVPEMTVGGVIQIIPASSEAINVLKNASEWKA